MPQVPATRTVPPGDGRDGRWASMLGYLVEAGCPREAAPMLVAHLAVEHGNDLNGWFNHNVGNVVLWRDPESVDWYTVLDSSGNWYKYQSFADFPSGLQPYLFEIRRRDGLWRAALAGDPEAFTRGLYTHFPGTPGSYIELPWTLDGKRPVKVGTEGARRMTAGEATAYLSSGIAYRYSRARLLSPAPVPPRSGGALGSVALLVLALAGLLLM